MSGQTTSSPSPQAGGRFRLIARQTNGGGVTPRIIYQKDVDVVFTVEGTGVAQATAFWWDLKGNGDRNAPYNGPNNGDRTSSRTIRYTNDADAAGNIQLREVWGNRRKRYPARVFVTAADGTVRECPVTVRVALATDVGDEFPANLGNPPGSNWQNTNAFLLTLYNWTEANQPNIWTAVNQVQDTATRNHYGLHATLIQGARIQVGTFPNLASTAQTGFSNMRIYGVFLREGAAGVETAFSHRMPILQSIVNHEWVHVQQFLDYIANPNGLWGQITTAGGGNARSQISEAQAYNEQIADDHTTFRFALLQNVLENFCHFYRLSHQQLPAPQVPALAGYVTNQFNYALATYPELNDHDYDYWIPAPP